MTLLFNTLSVRNKSRGLRKNSTEAEKKLWSKLRNKQLNGFRFHRQYGIGLYIVDFYCSQLRLVIEVDGGQHAEDKNYDYDEKRTQYLRTYNIQVLRYWNNEVLQNIDGVIQDILRHVPRNPT